MNTRAIRLQSEKRGRNHFAHVVQGIFAIAMAAIISVDVTVMLFEKASANWKQRTAVCLVTPTTSARGAMIGIVSAACPEPELTMKLIIVCTTNMPAAANDGGRILTI